MLTKRIWHACLSSQCSKTQYQIRCRICTDSHDQPMRGDSAPPLPAQFFMFLNKGLDCGLRHCEATVLYGIAAGKVVFAAHPPPHFTGIEGIE